MTIKELLSILELDINTNSRVTPTNRPNTLLPCRKDKGRALHPTEMPPLPHNSMLNNANKAINELRIQSLRA